jgi:hypothetical protein
LQVYTGFVYAGPGLVTTLNRLDTTPRSALVHPENR